LPKANAPQLYRGGIQPGGHLHIGGCRTGHGALNERYVDLVSMVNKI